MSVEPLVFAMLLLALTLSISMGLPHADASHDASQKAPATRTAAQAPQTESAEAAQAARPAQVAQMQ